MRENYWINIIGRQKIDDDVGEVTLAMPGSYVTKGDTRFIVYKEYDPNRNNAATTSVLKVGGGNTVTLTRSGGNTRLILEKGKRHQCQYDTGFDALLVGVFTSEVDSRLHDKGDELAMNYTLDINVSLSSINEILITIKEAEQKDVETSTASH